MKRFFIAIAILLLALYWGTRTQAPHLGPEVRTQTRDMILAGQRVHVTYYIPINVMEAPLVVVAHGFTRSKRYMAGWGAELAAQGFIVAVPTQPALADHELNARVLAELVERTRQGQIKLKVTPVGRVAMMGFSMGGLTTFLAAAKHPIDAWVGLDPVGMDDSWLQVAKDVKFPCAVLRAEPGAWNKNGNARALYAVLPTPKFTLKVRHSTHLDAESPTDFVGQLACGWTDPARQALFKRYAFAFLKAHLVDDRESLRVLHAANHDDGVTEVDDHLGQ